jgi:excisionase family DNA binding protein
MSTNYRSRTKDMDEEGKPPLRQPRCLLTVTEAADYLRVSKSAIYSWVERGRLPCLRAGSALRFRVSDLDAWLEGRERG